jgi:hypothetical protein
MAAAEDYGVRVKVRVRMVSEKEGNEGEAERE